jgi:nucleoside-diphosphate-sugar epimerase
MIRSCVTGGAGMLGSALVRALLKRGHEVVVIDDLSRGRKENVPAEAQFILHDLKAGMPFVPNTPAGTFDFIYHLAAWIGGVGKMIGEPFNSFQNVAIDFAVLDFAAQSKNKPRVLYMGTACEYPVEIQTEARAGNSWLQEDACFSHGANPESLYGWCKVVGEQGARTLHSHIGVPVAVARAFNMYGPGELAPIGKGHAIPELIQKAMKGGPDLEVWGTGEQERAFTFVDDAAEGVILMAEKIDDATPINIGTSELVKIKTLAEKIVGVVRPGMPLRFDTSKPMGVFTRAADVSRAKQLLGWEPKMMLDEGLKVTADWIKARV